MNEVEKLAKELFTHLGYEDWGGLQSNNEGIRNYCRGVAMRILAREKSLRECLKKKDEKLDSVVDSLFNVEMPGLAEVVQEIIAIKPSSESGGGE